MNRIITGRERKGHHPKKNLSFDILSLADQLHQSKSTLPEGPEQGKIYFFENKAPELFKQGQNFIRRKVDVYNKFIENNEMISWENNKEATNKFIKTPELFDELVGNNEKINEIFNLARQEADLTSDLSKLLL